MKEITDQLQKTTELSEIGLKNLKNNAEIVVLERSKSQRQLEKDRETLEE